MSRPKKSKKLKRLEDHYDHLIMEIPTEVYFNLIRKRIIEEDNRNEINIETGQVTLNPDVIINMEIGAVIGSLMVLVRKAAVAASADKLTLQEMKDRFLPLDPILGNLKEIDQAQNRHTNWTLIARELRKFGIIVEPKVKDRLVVGD